MRQRKMKPGPHAGAHIFCLRQEISSPSFPPQRNDNLRKPLSNKISSQNHPLPFVVLSSLALIVALTGLLQGHVGLKLGLIWISVDFHQSVRWSGQPP